MAQDERCGKRISVTAAGAGGVTHAMNDDSSRREFVKHNVQKGI
jgi:hypothetical protein